MKPSRFVNELIDKYVDNEELRKLLITHSRRVAEKAVEIAPRVGINTEHDLQFLYDAAMLHDIGIVECEAPGIFCHGKRPYLQHGIAGAEILRREGLDERFARVCERHTGAGLTAKEIGEGKLPLPERDFMPESIEEKLICYADKFFSKSGDPEKEKTPEAVMASMQRHGQEVKDRFMKLQGMFGTDKHI